MSKYVLLWFPMIVIAIGNGIAGEALYRGALGDLGDHQLSTVVLILFFAASQGWLARNPGDFAPLFAFAWGLGLVRTFLIVRLPERWQPCGERVRVRDALALACTPLLRRYLVTMAWGHAWRVTATVFGL